MTENKDFKNTAYSLNTTLTFIHVFLIISGVILNTWILAVFNLITLILYLVAYLFIKKHHVIFYLVFAISEIFIQMIVATICLGWESGFHLDAFGTISAVYYTKYIYSKEKKSQGISFLISASSIVIYTTLWIFSRYITPIYTLSKNILDAMYILHSLLIFGLMVQLLWRFSTSAILEESKLKKKAELDELTKLYNRHKLREMINEFHKRSMEPNSNLNYSICIFDIDDFKLFNDTYGHNAGDYILKETALIMKSFCQEANHLIGRWGGEEFLLVQEYESDNFRSEEKCKNTARLIHKTIRNHYFTLENTVVKVTLTGGFEIHNINDDINTTIKKADKKLYEGKSKEKNIIIF